jgi:hypothetical protein
MIGPNRTKRRWEGRVNSVLDERAHVMKAASVSARVFVEARKSFAAKIDAATLQEQVDEVVALLWTDSTTVTSFIALLALRDLRTRLASNIDLHRV